ncbi:MAG: hypothetical protein QOI76_983 [Frankiales bacterium]|nr:hypothetical protein [Frankiales bacterium]
MTGDIESRLARRGTVRRAVAFLGISAVIVLAVVGRSATEPTPHSALGGPDLAQPVGGAGAPAVSATTTAATPATPATPATKHPAAPTHPRPTAAATTPTTHHATATTTPAAPRTTTPAAPRRTTPRPTTAPPAPVQRTVTGAAYDVSYGVVEVRVTFKGRRILDVTAVSMPQGGRSGDISAMAGPQLRQEALTAQSANINAVSGASYTSAGYAKSLQSAIDRAGG